MSSSKASTAARRGPEVSAGAGLGLALLSAATFSTSGSFARSLTSAGWSPGAAVAARIATAALVLAIPAIIAMRGRWPVLRRNAGTIAIYGLIAVTGCQLCFYHAIGHLSVGVALLLEYLGTVLVVGWLWLRHGQRPRRLTVAGSIVAMAGLVLVLDLIGDTQLDAIGVMWALGGAVGLAVYFVLSSQCDPDLPPVAFTAFGLAVGTAALFGLGGLGVLPIHAAFGSVVLASHQVSWLVPVAGVSLVATAIAYVTGIGAARALGAKLASFVGLTEVMFGVLVAWLVLGELPTALQLVGGVLIVTGVALVRIDELRPAAQVPRAVALVASA